MFLFAIFIIILVLYLGEYLYSRYVSVGKLMARIPGCKGFALIGVGYDIFVSPEKLFQFIREFSKTYKDINKVNLLHYRAVNVYKPEAIQIALSASVSTEKRHPYILLEPWLRQGILINKGDTWHQRRKLLNPAFGFNVLKEFLGTFAERTEDLIAAVELEVGTAIDVHKLMTKTSLQIICESLLGSSMKENITRLSDKYLKSIQIYGKCLLFRISRIWLYTNFVYNFTKTSKIEKAVLGDMHEFTRRIIDERRKISNLYKDAYKNCTEKKNIALLDFLLDQEGKGNLNETYVREEIDTFIFAGHETTGTALRFILFNIANFPEVQDSVNEEMQKIFGDSQRRATAEDLTVMKYLECCIKETLRLYPSVPYINRFLMEDVVLGGYKIPAGTYCNVHVFDVHRREESFHEPEKFIPKRFLPENSMKRHPYSYLPFGAGPKNCIGQKYAMMEMKVILSGILRRFRIEPITKPEDVIFVCDIVLRTSKPVYVKFNKK